MFYGKYAFVVEENRACTAEKRPERKDEDDASFFAAVCKKRPQICASHSRNIKKVSQHTENDTADIQIKTLFEENTAEKDDRSYTEKKTDDNAESECLSFCPSDMVFPRHQFYRQCLIFEGFDAYADFPLCFSGNRIRKHYPLLPCRYRSEEHTSELQ